MDGLIISVFEEQEDAFTYPLTSEKDARLFVQSLHTKGCKYETIGKEVGGDGKDFEAWRGSTNAGPKDLVSKVLERINRPFQDTMASVGEKEEGASLLRQLSVEETKRLVSSQGKSASTARQPGPSAHVDKVAQAAPKMNKKQQLELLLKQKYISKQNELSRAKTALNHQTTSTNSTSYKASDVYSKLSNACTNIFSTCGETTISSKSITALGTSNTSKSVVPTAPQNLNSYTKSTTAITTTTNTQQSSSSPLSTSSASSLQTSSISSTTTTNLLKQLSSYTPALVTLSTTTPTTSTQNIAKTTSIQQPQTNATISTTKPSATNVSTKPSTTTPTTSETTSTTTTSETTSTTTTSKTTSTTTSSKTTTATTTSKKDSTADDDPERPPSPLTTSLHYKPFTPDFSPEELSTMLNYNSDDEDGVGNETTVFLLSDIPAGHMKTSKFTKFRVKLAASRKPLNRLKQALNYNPDLRMLASVKVSHRGDVLTKLRSSLAPFILKNKNDWYWASLKQVFAAFDEAVKK